MGAAPELSTTFAPRRYSRWPSSVAARAARTTVVRTPIGRTSGGAAPARAAHAQESNTAVSVSWFNEQAAISGGARGSAFRGPEEPALVRDSCAFRW